MWRMDLWTQRGEERGMNGENSTGTLPYVKQIAGGSVLYNTGGPARNGIT